MLLTSLTACAKTSAAEPSDLQTVADTSASTAAPTEIDPTIIETVPETTEEETVPETTEPSKYVPGTHVLTYEDAESEEYMEYCLFIPENATENMPLIVNLHGYGEIDNIEKIKTFGYIEKAREVYGEGFPFIALSPCNRTDSWITGNHLEMVHSIIELVAEEYEINREKIIITGHSLGAMGVWKMVNLYGNYFSCAVPVSYSAPFALDWNQYREVPVWAFVGEIGEQEEALYNSIMGNINGLNTYGCQGTFTQLKGCGHTDMATYTYTQETFDWMLAQ